MLKIIKFTLILFVVFPVNAQEFLSLEDAIKIALENNYEIKIAKNNLKIGATNNNFANAGMLPSISANLTNNNSEFNTTQTQADGSIRQLDGAKNMNLTYGLGLDWTVFDGLSMFARKEQLNLLESQGKLELQSTILNRISDVYLTYYDLVQQKQIITSIDSAIAISKQRVITAQNRYSIGKASKLELLNAKVDLNTDKSLLIKQKEQFKNTKIRLNELLARNLQIDFTVINDIQFESSLVYEELKELASKQNPQLQAQILSKKIADLNLKQIKGNRYPTIRITSGYNFTRSEASLGFITQSSGQGFVYGITASVPIFNGNLQNNREKTAKFEVENATFLLEQQKLALDSQLASFYQSYLTSLELVDLEKQNLEIAQQNLEITLAKFKIGTIIPLEVRAAQQNFIEASVRFSNAKYQTKLSEINLKELSGTLTFN